MFDQTNTVMAGAGEALILVVACTAAGVVLDLAIFRLLDSRAVRGNWEIGRKIARALRGLPTAAGVLVGLGLASAKLPFPSAFAGIARTGLRLAAILVVTAFAARVLGGVVRAYTDREDSRLPSSTIFVNLARSLVWVLGLIALLGALGVSIAPLITALGVGGLAVGLALQPTLENVFSGIQVLASRQIEPGNLIRLETGEEGTVLDVTWRNTTILTPSNDVVIVPNAVIGRSRVTNFSALDERHTVVIPVTVAGTADTQAVERCALQAAEEVVATVAGAVASEEPKIRFAAYGPAGIQVNAAIMVDTYPDRIPVRHAYIRRVHELLDEAQVESATAIVGADARVQQPQT